MLITNVQLPGSAAYDTHMYIHTSTVNKYISLEKGFQKNLSDPSRKNVVLDKGKYVKRASQRKWTECDYHVQDSKDMSHTSVKFLCATILSPALPFCVLHMKYHGVRGLVKHYCLVLDPKLGHGKC